jgi:hypothetical protein
MLCFASVHSSRRLSDASLRRPGAPCDLAPISSCRAQETGIRPGQCQVEPSAFQDRAIIDAADACVRQRWAVACGPAASSAIVMQARHPQGQIGRLDLLELNDHGGVGEREVGHARDVR